MGEAGARRHLHRALDTVCVVLDDLGPGLVTRGGTSIVSAKDDGTAITAVDLEVDDRLRTALAQRFPDHGYLSEEGNTTVPDTEWTWVVDPIDGTSNFTTGLPYWCVSIALCHHGSPVLAVVDAPVLDRRYIAMAGAGAWRNGRPIEVRAAGDWRDRTNRHLAVMLTTSTARRARAAGVRLNIRVMGSTALDLAMVADGGAVASVAMVPHVWDVAAGMLLVAEAGGAVANLNDRPLLPLTTGVDHRTVSAATAAAATEPYARSLAMSLTTA